jgi:hypothetical protein
MVNISRIESELIVSDIVLKLRMFFGVKYGCGGMMDNHGEGGGTDTLTIIKMIFY